MMNDDDNDDEYDDSDDDDVCDTFFIFLHHCFKVNGFLVGLMQPYSFSSAVNSEH